MGSLQRSPDLLAGKGEGSQGRKGIRGMERERKGRAGQRRGGVVR